MVSYVLTLLVVTYWSIAILIALARFLLAEHTTALRYGKSTSLNNASPPSPCCRHEDSVRRLLTRSLPVLQRGLAFRLFYVVGLAFDVGLVVFALFEGNRSVIPVLLLHTVHVARREWECRKVHRFSAHHTIPFLSFLAGSSFYAAVPITLYAFGTGRNPAHVHFLSGGNKTTDALSVAVFALCSYTQYRVHVALARLREPISVEEEYYRTVAGRREGMTNGGASATHFCDDPRRGLYSVPPFRCILFPHYTAEITLYLSLAVLAYDSGHRANLERLGNFYPFLFTMCNLAATAHEQREWYQRNLLVAVPGKPNAAKLPSFNLIPGVW